MVVKKVVVVAVGSERLDLKRWASQVEMARPSWSWS